MTRIFANGCALAALVLVMAIGGCDSDSGPATTNGDTSGGSDTVTGTDGSGTVDTSAPADTGGSADTGTVTDTGSPADTGTPPEDVAVTPDVTEPAAGEMGGACLGDGTCNEGECKGRPGGGDICTTDCEGNVDCPDFLRCEAVAAESMRCLPGPRGTGAIGDPCGEEMENGCASAICVEADEERGIFEDTCSNTCESDDDCAVPFPVCFGMVNLCLPILSGDLGGRCRLQGDCYEGDCILVPNIGERCTRTCTEDSECGQPYLACRTITTDSYCLMAQ